MELIACLLCRARLVDAARIHPEVIKTIALRLLPTEQDLLVPCLIFSSSLYQVMKRDFFAIAAPGMRQDRVGWDVADQVVGQSQFVVIAELEKAHRQCKNSASGRRPRWTCEGGARFV